MDTRHTGVPDERRYLLLDKAYSEGNLNQISTKLIEAYRDRKYGFLQRIGRALGSDTHVEGGNIGKLFAWLIMRYHPDRLAGYRQKLGNWSSNTDPSILDELGHILVMQEQIDRGPGAVTGTMPAQGSAIREDYVVDEEELADLGIREVDDMGRFEDDYVADLEYKRFIEVLHYEEFGSADIVIERQDLENLTGHLDLSKSDIADLEGVDYCTGLTQLDLSNNRIMDATLLGFVHGLEEVDLSNNSIDSLDWCSTLRNLKWLDISFNNVTDISVLSDASALEFVNLIGNPVREKQVRALSDSGVIVVH